MKVKKLFPKARLPVETPEGIVLHSFETFKTEFGEMHAYRTGVQAELPPGTVGLLVPTVQQSAMGAFVSGMVHAGHKGEIIVPIANLNRNAYEVHQGMPIARLLFLEIKDEKVEDDTPAPTPGPTPAAGGASTGPKGGGSIGGASGLPDGSVVPAGGAAGGADASSVKADETIPVKESPKSPAEAAAVHLQ